MKYFAGCLQIDPSHMNWLGTSWPVTYARTLTPSIGENIDTRGNQTMLFHKCVTIFKSKLCRNNGL